MQGLADGSNSTRHDQQPGKALTLVTDGKAGGLGTRPEFSIFLHSRRTGELSVEGGIESEVYARWRAYRLQSEGHFEVVSLRVKWVANS